MRMKFWKEPNELLDLKNILPEIKIILIGLINEGTIGKRISGQKSSSLKHWERKVRKNIFNKN